MHLKAHTILTHYVATLMFTRSLFYALLMVPPQSSTWITFTMQHFNTIRNSALSGMNIITRKNLQGKQVFLQRTVVQFRPCGFV